MTNLTVFQIMKNLKFIIRLMLCAAGYLFIIFILACALTSCKSTKYTKPAYTYKAVECAKF